MEIVNTCKCHICPIHYWIEYNYMNLENHLVFVMSVIYKSDIVNSYIDKFDHHFSDSSKFYHLKFMILFV